MAESIGTTDSPMEILVEAASDASVIGWITNDARGGKGRGVDGLDDRLGVFRHHLRGRGPARDRPAAQHRRLVRRPRRGPDHAAARSSGPSRHGGGTAGGHGGAAGTPARLHRPATPAGDFPAYPYGPGPALAVLSGQPERAAQHRVKPLEPSDQHQPPDRRRRPRRGVRALPAMIRSSPAVIRSSPAVIRSSPAVIRSILTPRRPP